MSLCSRQFIAFSMALDSYSLPLLEAALGQFVTLDLAGGGSREGHVLSIDPEARDVLVVDERERRVALVCGPSIAAMRFSAPDREASWAGGAEGAAEVVRNILSGGAAEKTAGEEGAEEALAALCARLDRLHLPYDVSEGQREVVVLQGALRVVAPFGRSECRATNAVILQSMTSNLFDAGSSILE